MSMVVNRVALLREVLKRKSVCHEKCLQQEATLKDAHIYCVLNGLSAQKFGPMLERYIIDTFGFVKNSASDCTGDCVKANANTEIKVSLGGQSHSKFNYVQIRVNHQVDKYLLTAYSLNEGNVENQGELFVFRVSHNDMLSLLLHHGTYAHGTKKANGPITEEDLNDRQNTKEYALRPTVGDLCWQALLPFRVEEKEL